MYFSILQRFHPTFCPPCLNDKRKADFFERGNPLFCWCMLLDGGDLEEDVGEGGEGDGGPEEDALDEGFDADGFEGVE